MAEEKPQQQGMTPAEKEAATRCLKGHRMVANMLLRELAETARLINRREGGAASWRWPPSTSRSVACSWARPWPKWGTSCRRSSAMAANASSPSPSSPSPSAPAAYTISPFARRVIDHVGLVTNCLMRIEHQLWKRAMRHDRSKFDPQEYDLYASVQGEWEKHPYGSQGYERLLERIRPAVEHHVKHNRHHPEYFADGVSGMHLVDLVEMACDWWAASKRSGGRDIHESLSSTLQKFGIEPQLASILAHTMQLLDDLVGDGSPRAEELAFAHEERERNERQWQ